MVSIVQQAAADGVDTGTEARRCALVLPKAPLVGHVLIAAVGIDKSAGAFNAPPAGWSWLGDPRVQASVSQAVAWRVADGSATDLACTLSWTSAVNHEGLIFEVDAISSGTPVAVVNPASETATNTITVDAGSADADGFALSFWSQDSEDNANNVTYSGSYLPLVSTVAATGTGGANVFVAGKNLADSGSTVVTVTATTSDQTTMRVARFPATLTQTATNTSSALLSRVVGIPTATTVTVTARVAGTTSARLRLATDAALTQGVVTGPSTTPDARGVATLTASGLASGTRYYYRVEMTGPTGTATDTGPIGRVRTARTGQASFAFCFGSCTNASDSEAMAAIAARGDDLFFHLGDLYYADGSGTGVQNVRDKMNAKITAPNHAAVFSTIATGYAGSDHDAMNNGSTLASNPTGIASWNTAYRELFPTPPLAAAGGVYFSYAWGRVRFIHLDTRSYKSGSTALGSTQKQWLKTQVATATEPVIVIVQGDSGWVGTSDSDQWSGYSAERTELGEFFANSGKNIAMLAGDAHMLAAHAGGSASPGGIAVFQAAPLNNGASRKGGPWTAGPYPASGSDRVSQYGRIAVTDTGSQIALAYTGYSADGTQRVTLTKTYATTTTTGPVTPPPDSSAVATAVKAWRRTSVATSSSSLAVLLPAAGDGENQWRFDATRSQQVVIAVATGAGSITQGPAVPSGWTEVVPPVVSGAGATLALYRRAAVAGDEGKSVTVTFADSLSHRSAIALVVEGATALNGTPVSRKDSYTTNVTAGGMTLTQTPGLVLQAGVVRHDASATPISFERTSAGDAATPDTYPDGYQGVQVSSNATSRNAALVLAWRTEQTATAVPATVFKASYAGPWAAAQYAYTSLGATQAPPDAQALAQWEVLTPEGVWAPAVLEVLCPDGAWR